MSEMGFSSVMGIAWLNMMPSRRPEPPIVNFSTFMYCVNDFTTASAAGRISALPEERPLIFFFLSRSSTLIMS